VVLAKSLDNGQTMRLMVTPEDMALSPRWTEAERNPPLPARDALREAQNLLVKLTPEASQFTFRSIELQPLPVSDVWVYLVKFVSELPQKTSTAK
jgi:hypothetical protein